MPESLLLKGIIFVFYGTDPELQLMARRSAGLADAGLWKFRELRQ